MSFIKNNIIKPFFIALIFFTYIPLPIKINTFTDKDLGKSALYYPFIGFIIGIILYFTYFLLKNHNINLVAVIILTIWVVITGGLHIDGFADSADAWVGGHHCPLRTLEIMRDAYCGPIAVSALVLLLLIKFIALTVLLKTPLPFCLILIPALSRASVVALLLLVKYVQPDEIGTKISKNIPKLPAWIIIGAVFMVSFYFLKHSSIKVFLTIIISSFILIRAMQKRIGGTTGDTAGAFIEIIEAALLLILALSYA